MQTALSKDFLTGLFPRYIFNGVVCCHFHQSSKSSLIDQYEANVSFGRTFFRTAFMKTC